uniref:chromogranin-A n=1 Tax=Pristiophorus japonicus TaxID=55135 RepID=UPI00398F8BEA
MIALGFLTFLLLANQAFSSPVPSEQSKADAKVMKCVVEVISDTLSKPSPLPISQECMDALRGDERINSVLRHQNLLRELQELAVEGANEKVHQKKQNNYKDELSAALKSHIDKRISSADKSQEIPTEEQQGSTAEVMGIKDKEEQDRIKGTQPNVSGHSFLDNKDTTTDSNSDETNSRDMTTEKKDARGDGQMKRGSTESESVAEQSQDQSQSEEQNTEESEQSEDEYTQDEEVDEDEIKESEEEDEEENHSHYDESKDEELANGEEPSQEGRGDEETKVEDRSQSEDRDHSDRDGKVFEEERRSNEDNMSHQNSEEEEIEEDEYSNDTDEKDGLSEEELEESKKWKMMGELAQERNSRKRGEMSDEDTSELEGKGKSIGSGNPKQHNKHSNFQHLWENRRSHSEEDISEKGKKKSTASYLGRKRFNVEDKKEKEEEGSANRKNEEQDVENLEEIENELEDMARRLHQLRQS